jgi:hypothetical protein
MLRMKDRGLWIIIGLFIVAGVVWGVWHSLVPQEQNRGVDNQPQPMVQATTTPQAPTPSGITYTADGKIDTSDWVEYRSEYGGFSVRAPKERAGMGCYAKCDPAMDGESFTYFVTESSDQGPGFPGLHIEVIKKKSGATINNWVAKYITSGSDHITNQHTLSINGHSALQFDVLGARPQEVVLTGVYAPYPRGIESPRMTPTQPARFYVIDMGDRFALVERMIAYDKGILNQYSGSVFDEQTLNNVFNAILDSFQVVQPTRV